MKNILLLTSILFFFSLSTFAQEVRIAAIGDYGAATLGAQYEAYELSVANLVKSWDQPNNPLDAIITVGDNNYDFGLQEDIEQNIGQFYGSFIQGHPDFAGGANRFFPAIGNHDYGTHDCNLEGDIAPYLNYFELPSNELYYDYVIGNVHFFVVDSDCHQPAGNNTNSAQAQWLETTMTNSVHPWKIVYFHHAPYASGRNGDTGVGTLRWDFKAWGATAVIGGHYHIYERILVDGLVYFVNGVGGNALHDLTQQIPESQFQYNQNHGAMLMTFTADQANFKMVNIENEVVDNYTIGLGNTCSQLGGDSDNDGVCDAEDCAPNNSLLPAPVGSACDDNNALTNNDVIQSDACTCAGTPNSGGACGELPNFTKFGELNNHAYYRSQNTVSGWAAAQTQSATAGGYLLSIEDQAEKDFIDPLMTGVGDDRIYYIGLSRNQNGNFVWSSDQSVLNVSNYSTSPWSGSSTSSTNDFVTMRKWNPSANVSWGAENGKAGRRFMMEKSCAVDCSNQGGDSDGDGVCDNLDCAPNNENLPALPNSTCNDGNPNTSNDVIQVDGCTCQGTMETSNACEDIPNFTKLGVMNGKGYYRSNGNASGWENARTQSIGLGGNLLSIESQVEKDFIDQFISGTGDDKILYIGLRQNGTGQYIWSSDQSSFNENNYSISPWEGGSVPSSGEAVTLRKWNTNAPVRWGTESGGAYRKFIFEKGCSNSNACGGQGGDSDGDGVCDNQDCAPTDSSLPAPPNSTCDDGNATTINDVIQADGCTCLGESESSMFDCDEVSFSTGNGSITIGNLHAPIEIVKVYDATYNEVFVCINSCANTETISGLSSGFYHIEIQTFSAAWEATSVCRKDLAIFGNRNFDSNDVLETQQLVNKTIHLQNQFSIYPNPVEERLFVQFAEGSDLDGRFKIYNSLGQLEKEFVVEASGDRVFDFWVGDLEVGIYFIYYEEEGGRSETKRFIVR